MAVISLGRPDRQEAFVARAERASVQFRWADGVVETRPDYFRGSNGAWGCARAHGTLLMSGHGDLLVLEDDADLPVDFWVQFDAACAKLPVGWGLLKLGGQHIKQPLPIADGLVRPRYMIRTHAYFVHSNYREHVAAAAVGATGAWDGHFARLDHFGRSYAPSPLIVPVYASPSDIPDSLPWEAFK